MDPGLITVSILWGKNGAKFFFLLLLVSISYIQEWHIFNIFQAASSYLNKYEETMNFSLKKKLDLVLQGFLNPTTEKWGRNGAAT